MKYPTVLKCAADVLGKSRPTNDPPTQIKIWF